MKTTKPEGHCQIVMGNPKKVYRVIIQQKTPKDKEQCRSFTLYDYTGKSNIEKVKEKLSSRAIRIHK